MKKLFIFTFLAILITSSWASNYMTIPGWQNCAKPIDQKIYKFFCLPETKPTNCSTSAWNTLKKGEMLPNCPLCPKK